MQIEKNLKYRRSLDKACGHTLYFNPKYRFDNVQVFSELEQPVGDPYWQQWLFTGTVDPATLGVNVGDVVLVGGQMGTFVESIYLNTGNYFLICATPYGTYYTVDPDIIVDSVKEYDNVYVFRPYYENGDYTSAFWWNDGADNITEILPSGGSVWDDPNILQDVLILEYEMISDLSLYGHHKKSYNANNTYKVKLAFDYNTPVEKINQIIQSEALALQPNDRETFTYTNDYNYLYPKPLGGGSISPLVRKLTLISKTLKENYGRRRYEVIAILEG